MMPSQAFHDSGELQTAVATLSVAHPTGFPTYILLGKFFISIIPFGKIAWKVNLISAVYSTLNLFILGIFVIKLTKNISWPIIGILYLAFNLPLWNWAGIADTHSLSRLFLFLLILLFFTCLKNGIKKTYFYSL